MRRWSPEGTPNGILMRGMPSPSEFSSRLVVRLESGVEVSADAVLGGVQFPIVHEARAEVGELVVRCRPIA